MFRRSLFAPILGLSLCVSACGDDRFATVSGSVSGIKLAPQAYYWGGPFIVFTNQTGSCEDMYWVIKGNYYETGDEPPVESDLEALQFTFQDSDVIAGTYSVEGDAPVFADFVTVSDGALTVYGAETGTLIVDEISKDDRALGTFDLTFEDGTVTGEFDIDWCNNIKDRY